MLAFAPNIALVFVARIIEGVSGGNISITQAYVADLVEPKDRSRAFGLIGAMFGAGMIFGPFVGGLLFARFGFAAPFLAAAALQAATLLITVIMLPESRAQVEGDERVGVREILASFRKPRLSRILWQKLAIAMGLYGWFAVIALYLQHQLGFTLTQTDYFFSIFAVFNVFCNVVLIGRISAWLGDRAMSNVGLVSLAGAFASLPFVHDLALLALTMILFSFGLALANTGITALISNAASDREQGIVLGTSSSLDSLSGILAPPISTGLLTAFGPAFAGIESVSFVTVALAMGLLNARGESRDARADGEALTLAADVEAMKAEN
jgi:DHA1 family tetracycline resistance protein-like MFS transporter